MSLLEKNLFLIVSGVLALIIAAILTIIIFALVLPENKKEKLPKFFKWLADIFNFKSLLLEKILKFLYILSTIFCIVMGLIMLFWFQTNWGMGGYTWKGWWGLIVMIGGPIGLRIIYEIIMLFIILVKNSEEIKKACKKNA